MGNSTTTRRLKKRYVLAFGLAILYLLLLRSSPTLQLWHTESLIGEFSLEQEESVSSLEDYLDLEAKLFEELERKVYDRVPRGSGLELNRYSSGSAADPSSQSPNWNRSFELKSAAPAGGVLLLHGMSDSPYSLRALGQHLNRQGYWVVGLRMPGHGTIPSGLRKVTWEDMAAATKIGAAYLNSRIGGQPLHLVGYSTGAALALNYTLDQLEQKAGSVPASLTLVSPAIGIHPAARLAAFKDTVAVLPGLGHLAWLSVHPEFDPYKYNSFATNAGTQVHRLTRSVSARLAARAESSPPETFPPVLVFKSTVDATVSVNDVIDGLLIPLNGDQHELVLFDINRLALKSPLLISDPAPVTDRLINSPSLPFTLTLVTNREVTTPKVAAIRWPSRSSKDQEVNNLDMQWPPGTISLSHVALPFPPDDPLYGSKARPDSDLVFLGLMDLKGELNLLKIPYDWLLRLRHNPFYDYLETRTSQWLKHTGGQ